MISNNFQKIIIFFLLIFMLLFVSCQSQTNNVSHKNTISEIINCDNLPGLNQSYCYAQNAYNKKDVHYCDSAPDESFFYEPNNDTFIVRDLCYYKYVSLVFDEFVETFEPVSLPDDICEDIVLDNAYDLCWNAHGSLRNIHGERVPNHR
mgnify:CR=1 FL=1